MRVNKYLMPGLVVLTLLATVGVAQATGYWIVSGKQMVDVENLVSSADIRGWMTLKEVADGFAIELATLYEMVGVPADIPASTALKEMEGVLPDFETGAVRDAVAAYLDEATPVQANGTDVPAEGGTPVTKPGDGAEVTFLQEALSSETPAHIEESHVPVSQGDGSGIGPTAVGPGDMLAATDIKGRHTLQEIAEQAQVPLEDLLEALGLPTDMDSSLTVRQLVESGKIAEVDAVRVAVAELQSK